MDNVVVVGSINMDTNLNVPYIPEIGETILASNVSYHSGGKGANQAVTVSRLGGKVNMIGAVGNDKNGEKLLNNLKKENIGSEGLLIKDGVSTGFAIINVSDNGDNNIIVYSGANHAITRKDIDNNKEIISSAEYCILQMEISYEIIKYVITLCAESDTRVVLNPAPARAEMDAEILKKVDFLIPNETELMILANREINGDNIIDICREIIRKGCKNIIVTLGDKGCIWVNEKSHKYYSAEKVKTVDTTGAGDSFVGAFAYMLSKGKSINETINFATKVASITVTRKGAQSSIPSIDEVNKY